MIAQKVVQPGFVNSVPQMIMVQQPMVFGVPPPLLPTIITPPIISQILPTPLSPLGRIVDDLPIRQIVTPTLKNSAPIHIINKVLKNSGVS